MHHLTSRRVPAPRPVPEGEVVVAIGDVHGHLAHLDALLDHLRPLLDGHRRAGRRVLVVPLGDYVDRGPDSIGTLRRIAGLEATLGVPVRPLRGNHDQFLIDFVGERAQTFDDLELWLANGGDRTLAELGLGGDVFLRKTLAELRGQARDALGPELGRFVTSLDYAVELGAWLFVHGGIHPRTPLADQEPASWLWMREPFLTGKRWAHPFCVVHGHTVRRPELLPHRIGIDTGCYRTGVLAALEIAQDGVQLHAVTSDPHLQLLGKLAGGTPELALEAAPAA